MLSNDDRDRIATEQREANAEAIARYAAEAPAKLAGVDEQRLWQSLKDVAEKNLRNPAAAPLKPIEAGALMDLNLPVPQPMLGPILRRGALVMVHGPAGVGKTYLKLAIAVAVSHSVELLGWNVPQPISVLYIDGEMTAFEMQQRLKDLTGPVHETIDHSWKQLQIITPDLQDGAIPKIDSLEGHSAILGLVDSIEGLGLAIFDNLSCLTNPEDDNAASSWSAVQELLLALRRRGIACILGHHSGKSGAQRGTSRRADILDVILKLSPVTDGPTDGRTRITVEFEKGRSLTAEQKTPFVAVLETHPSGGLIWSRSTASIPVGDRARQMLLDGMPPGDIAAELGAARSFVYRIREQLIESGELADANQRRSRKSRGQTSNAAAVVPFVPPYKGGQGTLRHSRVGDRSGDNEGTQGTEHAQA